jgi:hypothetical protein
MIPHAAAGADRSAAAAAQRFTALAPEVQEIWTPYLVRLAAAKTADDGIDQWSMSELAEHDSEEPDLLVWHGLAHMRPYFTDVGGTEDPGVIGYFVTERLEEHYDLGPLLWALGLQPSVVSTECSPLPPPLQPPLSPEAKASLLEEAVEHIERDCERWARKLYWPHRTTYYLAALRSIFLELQEQQPEVLKGFSGTRLLWNLHETAREVQAFWHLLVEVPALQRDIQFLTQELHVMQPVHVAQGLVSLGLLPQCAPEDIWWLVARLDHATGDRGKVLMLFEQLALQQPWHGAFDHLGHLLLHFAQRQALFKQTSGQDPTFQKPERLFKSYFGLSSEEMVKVAKAMPEWFKPENLVTEVFPRLTCRMPGAQVVAWVEQLQEMWWAEESHRLLLQLLMAPEQSGAFTAAQRRKLYDLMLLQLARPAWGEQGGGEKVEEVEGEQQQPAKCLPPAAADMVLGLLPDVSARQVLVVWRHVCGTVQPDWFSPQHLVWSDNTLEGMGQEAGDQLQSALNSLQDYQKGGEPPQQWKINMLYDAEGVLTPADVDRSGAVRGAVEGYAALKQRRQQLFSALSPEGQRKVAAAMKDLKLPFDLVSDGQAEGQ